MLEWFDKTWHDGRECKDSFRAECRKYPNLDKFVLHYIKEESELVSRYTLFNMFRFYKVTPVRNMQQIKDIGEFVQKCVFKLKMRELHGRDWKTEMPNTPKIERTDIKFLLKGITNLTKNVKYGNRYRILKNMFYQMSEDDIKWFSRFLCKEVKITKPIKEVIENVECGM